MKDITFGRMLPIDICHCCLVISSGWQEGSPDRVFISWAGLVAADRGIAALSREGTPEGYRRARARPYRRAGNRWLGEPIRRG